MSKVYIGLQSFAVAVKDVVQMKTKEWECFNFSFSVGQIHG